MITVTINTTTIKYHLVETTAPSAADGFGTFTLYECSSEGAKPQMRMVLVQDEHLNWQLARYHSGLWGADVWENDASMQRYIANRLWEKLTRIEH